MKHQENTSVQMEAAIIHKGIAAEAVKSRGSWNFMQSIMEYILRILYFKWRGVLPFIRIGIINNKVRGKSEMQCKAKMKYKARIKYKV